MEQPPLIDVEPESSGKSGGGCGGCIGKLIPMLAGLMLLAIILMGAAWFIWGKGLREDDGSTAAGEAAKEEKGGFGGLMEKAKAAIKGESSDKTEEVAGQEKAAGGANSGQGAGGNAMQSAVDKSTALAESVGAEAKTPGERNQALKEKFGHMEENRPDSSGGGDGVNLAEQAKGAGGSTGLAENLGELDGQAGDALNLAPGVVKMTTEGSSQRGGAFGSSTGAAIRGGKNNDYLIWRGDLATAGSDLQFEIIFRQAGNQLHFRCFLMPYDSEAARLFQGDKGDLLLSFHALTSEQLVPKEGAYPVPLTEMSAFERDGKVAGWVTRGMIPMEGAVMADLSTVKVAWDLDQELSDWLKELKKNR